MIKLKNIDLNNVSISEQMNKISEEDNEFDMAVLEYCHDNDIKNKNHLVEEFWDTVQARLGVLQKVDVDAKEVMEQYPMHLEKIKSRPR